MLDEHYLSITLFRTVSGSIELLGGMKNQVESQSIVLCVSVEPSLKAWIGSIEADILFISLHLTSEVKICSADTDWTVISMGYFV